MEAEGSSRGGVATSDSSKPYEQRGVVVVVVVDECTLSLVAFREALHDRTG